MRQVAWIAALSVLGALFVSSPTLGQSSAAPANQADVAKCLEDGQTALRSGRFEKAIKAFTKADKLAGGGSARALMGVAAANLRKRPFRWRPILPNKPWP